MSDQLLGHYEKELAFIRQSAEEFSRRYPKIAGRLQLGAEDLEDPLVERLISAFAYLNAHVQQKLDDDFPELTDALLSTLYPHYQNPVPSMSIVQFEPEAGLDKGVVIDAGIELETERFQGETCHFRTAYPLHLQPLRVSRAKLMLRPFIAPGSTAVGGAGAVIHVKLEAANSQLKISDFAPQSLRFFLRGLPQHAYPLYELLLNNCVKVVVAGSEQDSQPTYLGADNLRAVGFEPAESLLPYPDTAFPGYRLLTEFFVFPEKFLFIDLLGLGNACRRIDGNELHLYFYLGSADAELEHQISDKSFVLGCAPAINLFPVKADPILMHETASQYHVVPDSRRVGSLEIYSLQAVVAIDDEERRIPYQPFYSLQHREKEGGCYWYGSRRSVVEGEHRNELASEMDISLVDLSFNPNRPDVRSLDISLLCFNRNLPAKLPFAGGRLAMKVITGGVPAGAHCITAPSQTLRPPLKRNAYWRLVSHLNLNHLSLSGGADAGAPLKEILRLYDFRDSASTRTTIDAISRISTRSISAPITVDNRCVLCRGTEVTLEFDSMMLAGSSAYLFASVLERFFAVYCSINSFVRLIARSSRREGDLKRWPPRSGDRALL
jgi:type VI secretion system protein ImpG